MFTNILLIHKISVYAFLAIYILKLIGLLVNVNSLKNLFVLKPVRILEMIVSTLFLLTGVYMILQMPGSTIGMFLLIKIALIVIIIPVAIIGFKRGSKLLATLSVLGLIMAYGLAEMNRSRPVTSKSILSSAVSSQEVYIGAGCQNCHGATGNAPVAAIGAPDLAASKLNDEEIAHIISKGKNGMPAFKKVLKEEDIKGLVEYVKSFRAASSKAPE